MVSRELDSLPFPYLPLRFQVGRFVFEEEGLLDTGFEGGIAVPPDILRDVGPPDLLPTRLRPVLGPHVDAPTYAGFFHIGNLGPFPVDIIAAGDEILIGQQAIAHLTITLDHGQRVVVSP